jgi:hypothetical protein
LVAAGVEAAGVVVVMTYASDMDVEPGTARQG